MALNADALGLALYNKAKEWNDRDIDTDNLEIERLDFWKALATEIIDHIKTNGVLKVPGAGLIAPSGGGAVTGNSITGKME